MGIKNRVKQLLYEHLDYKHYVMCSYYRYFGHFPDLNHPKLFSEKLWWLKYYNGKYQKELLQKCYDKYTVRDYVKEKGLESILNDVIGKYTDANDINFRELPEKYVIKVTQSSGKNFICTNKALADEEYWKTVLNKWLIETNSTDSNSFDEGYLLNGKAILLCEKLLEDEECQMPLDYRVFCFNGEPKYIVCDIGTTKADGTHGTTIYRNTYNLNWELQPVNLGRMRNEEILIEKPENLQEILHVAKILSEDFVFARIDLYNIQNNITFGEITWIPMGGAGRIQPTSWDEKLGKELSLPQVELFD